MELDGVHFCLFALKQLLHRYEDSSTRLCRKGPEWPQLEWLDGVHFLSQLDGRRLRVIPELDRSFR